MQVGFVTPNFNFEIPKALPSIRGPTWPRIVSSASGVILHLLLETLYQIKEARALSSVSSILDNLRLRLRSTVRGSLWIIELGTSSIFIFNLTIYSVRYGSAVMISFSTCTGGDPKFWPAYIRHLILINVCSMVFLVNMNSSGIATGFNELAMEFGASSAQLTKTISYPVLALGVGNLFWTPTSICFGKRPTVIAALLVFLAGNIWSIKVTSLNSLIASRVVAAFAGGSIDSIGPAIITDLYMERYFATAMAVYSFSLSGGSQIGPMIAGFLIGAKGWRWFFILCVILAGANFVSILFFLPETNHRRDLYDDATAEEADKQAVQMMELKNAGIEANDTSVSPTLDLNPAYAGSYWKDLISFRDRGVDTRGILGWPQQFSLPFRFILVPHVLFATISYGVFISGPVMISTISPQILYAPPYLLTSSGVGLFSLASFIGIVVAFPIAGPLTDSLSRAVGRRYHPDTHVPEDRLPALIVPFIVAPPGLVLMGYIFQNQMSVYIAAVGFAMQVSGLVLVSSSVLSVVVDGWPASGSEALVLINAGKNAIAFGFTLSSPNWLARQGLVKMFWEMATIQWAILVLGTGLYSWGPWLRKKTHWLV